MGLLFVTLAVLLIAVIALGLKKCDSLELGIEESKGKSASGNFRYGTVATDNEICSRIGNDILVKGSVVDAAIASLLCLGVVNAQHTGIGGGLFMVINARPRGADPDRPFEVVSLQSRESAPMYMDKDYFAGQEPGADRTGPLSILIPGEINGYKAAWERFGVLPWKDLFLPTIQLCENGWEVSDVMADTIAQMISMINGSESLSEQFLKSDGEPYQAGENMTAPKLKETLTRIAEEGPDTFYKGALLQDILLDLADAGGVNYTSDDFAANEPIWYEPLQGRLHNGDYVINAVPPPSSGAAVIHSLKILDAFNLSLEDFTPDKKAQTLHKFVESWKFAFARRNYVGDIHYDTDGNITKMVQSMVSDDIALDSMERISDKVLNDYGPFESRDDPSGSTTHVSILAPDGSAVSATGTVGSKFGCGVRGTRTGIIFNNGASLFNLPSETAVTSNYPAPGKRGMSSTSPVLIMNNRNESELVLGGSGGPRIITAMSAVCIALENVLNIAYSCHQIQVAAQFLWMNRTIVESVDEARVHSVLNSPLYYDADISQSVLDEMTKMGYKDQELFSPKYPYLAVVQAASRRDCEKCEDFLCQKTCVKSVSDWRKKGVPDGF
ncbi:hypothetical protein CAPTEDRAFT_226244 [Capitella teleta]|uniref:Gamma-glutamyltransferase n=1 Tax=Capitella teleta TaxID=283909 RepID=R7TZE5_CAPTE|nr:hypothetical protein CAPTEDRAFT_226244 [Capitella teleta]|eukprot:ELT99293.1 hypothetical protein CAPTEDRAFT_226244 [Capitella teleta]